MKIANFLKKGGGYCAVQVRTDLGAYYSIVVDLRVCAAKRPLSLKAKIVCLYRGFFRRTPIDSTLQKQAPINYRPIAARIDAPRPQRTEAKRQRNAAI